MAQNQALAEGYEERYRQVVVEGLGLPTDSSTMPSKEASAPSEKPGKDASQAAGGQLRLSLINEERDDEQSSTDNQNKGPNNRQVRPNLPAELQMEGASAASPGSPKTATDVEGSALRRREQRSAERQGQSQYQSSSAQRECERAPATGSQNERKVESVKDKNKAA